MKPSGIEWIGDIPDDWEVRKGKFLFKQRNSRGNTKKLELLSPTQKYGVIPQSKYEELTGMKPVKLDINADLASLKTICNGDYCISLRSFQGGFEYSSYEGVVSPAYQVFYPTKLISRQYYKYLFKVQSFIDKINSYAMSLRDGKNISFEDFSTTYLPFPPLKTQQRIADYLDEKCGEIDATIAKQKIAKQKESIEKLKAYKQSLISETVTKGLDKSAPLKPSGIEWIGDIPDDWEVRKLLSIFKEHKDRNKNLEEQNLLSLSYGKIKRKDINNNDGLLPASFETYNIVENGDIVFRLTDLQNDKRSLRTGIVTQRGIITSAYVTIRPKIRLDSRFFHYLYHMYDICKVFYGMGDGVRQGMGFEDLKNIPTLIPPLKTQQKIADYLDSKCSQIDKYITEKQNIIQKLDAYKKSLIFECVTGKQIT